MAQRHAVRFVKNDYRQVSSVTAMLKELNWDTLESRRTLFQLKYDHKMFFSQVALHPFDYFERNIYSGLRNSHSKKHDDDDEDDGDDDDDDDSDDDD